MRPLARLLPALLSLAACVEAPTLGAAPPPSDLPAPDLVPLAGLLAQADAAAAEVPPTEDLVARAAALDARVAALAGPALPDEAERIAALRARAEALRLPSLQ